jgi:hypothetical protein
LARSEARQAGLEGARIAVVEHPIGGTAKAELGRRGEGAADEILALLSN